MANTTQTTEVLVRKYHLFSAQTGASFGEVEASSVEDALDEFALSKGFADRFTMWDAGSFEYVSAIEARS